MEINRNLAYGIIALALVVIVLTVVSTVAHSPTAPENNIMTVTEGTQNAAAVVQAATVGHVQNINWNPANFSSSNVSVSVIRKTTNDPARYELVRVIHASTANNGSTVWTPSSNELGSDIYIQIGCVNATTACHSMISQSSLSVSQ